MSWEKVRDLPGPPGPGLLRGHRASGHWDNLMGSEGEGPCKGSYIEIGDHGRVLVSGSRDLGLNLCCHIFSVPQPVSPAKQ
jgi:hypothetical protein